MSLNLNVMIIYAMAFGVSTFRRVSAKYRWTIRGQDWRKTNQEALGVIQLRQGHTQMKRREIWATEQLCELNVTAKRKKEFFQSNAFRHIWNPKSGKHNCLAWSCTFRYQCKTGLDFNACSIASHHSYCTSSVLIVLHLKIYIVLKSGYSLQLMTCLLATFFLSGIFEMVYHNWQHLKFDEIQ